MDGQEVIDAPHSQDVFVNNANLLVDAKFNHYTNAHVGLVYQRWAGYSHGTGFATATSHSHYPNQALEQHSAGPLYTQDGRAPLAMQIL